LRRSEQLQGENERLRRDRGGTDMIARSPAMQPVLDLVERIGPSTANVG
jgi:DNA-binding NtrC family response regulator